VNGLRRERHRLGGALVVSLVVAIAVLCVMALSGYIYISSWWQRPMAVDEPAAVEIARNESASDLARTLRARGFTDAELPFELMLRITRQTRSLQAGEYRVAPGDSPAAFVARVILGDTIRYQFKIIEGSRVRDVLAALAAEERLVQTIESGATDSLATLIGDEAPDVDPEGWLFPATYDFSKGQTDRSLLRRAWRKMRSELDDAWRDRAGGLPYAQPEELLIIASLIEKESGRATDRTDISQVFVNRLRRNMRLQTDPTVIYGLGETFDGNLTRAHLRQESPYNTYVNHGLPPTAIALPGRESLEAAAHPGEGDYLFFVARGDGTTQFSATLDEHNAAVAEYQLRGRRAQ
jgi:UPF0755 protein